MEFFHLVDILNSFTNIIDSLINLLNGFLIPSVGVGGGVEARESVNLILTIQNTIIFLSIVGLVFGFGLAIAAKKFAVKVDPRIEAVTEVLANAHCGGCGYAGCRQYAEAVVTNPNVPPTLCTPGGEKTAKLVAQITGKIPVIRESEFSRIMCQGDSTKALGKFKYEGITDCRAAVLAGGGVKSCDYGCLGFGTCERACPFKAIKMNEYNLPIVDIEKCTGCKVCANVCPKKVIEILPGSKAVIVACHSKDRGTDVRLKCQVGCIACGTCVKVCPFEAVALTDNLARINVDKCKVCGLCKAKCPTKAIVDLLPNRNKAYIIDEKCIGCNMCMKVCPVNAAFGEMKKIHTIDANRCIGCGICTTKCPKQAIAGTFNTETVLSGVKNKSKESIAV